nr:DDB1- and CUL4-associated factor 16 isoform X1 [Equus caballus]
MAPGPRGHEPRPRAAAAAGPTTGRVSTEPPQPPISRPLGAQGAVTAPAFKNLPRAKETPRDCRGSAARPEREETGPPTSSPAVWAHAPGVYPAFVWVGRGVSKRRDRGLARKWCEQGGRAERRCDCWDRAGGARPRWVLRLGVRRERRQDPPWSSHSQVKTTFPDSPTTKSPISKGICTTYGKHPICAHQISLTTHPAIPLHKSCRTSGQRRRPLSFFLSPSRYTIPANKTEYTKCLFTIS